DRAGGGDHHHRHSPRRSRPLVPGSHPEGQDGEDEPRDHQRRQGLVLLESRERERRHGPRRDPTFLDRSGGLSCHPDHPRPRRVGETPRLRSAEGRRVRKSHRVSGERSGALLPLATGIPIAEGAHDPCAEHQRRIRSSVLLAVDVLHGGNGSGHRLGRLRLGAAPHVEFDSRRSTRLLRLCDSAFWRWGIPSLWLSNQLKTLATQTILQRHDILRRSMRAICKHFNFESTILYTWAVTSNAPITFSVRIIAAIIPFHILVADLCKERRVSLFDCVDIDLGETEVGHGCATADRYDCVFTPIARHVAVNDLALFNGKIHVIFLEFTFAHADRLADTLFAKFLRA